MSRSQRYEQYCLMVHEIMEEHSASIFMLQC